MACQKLIVLAFLAFAIVVAVMAEEEGAATEVADQKGEGSAYFGHYAHGPYGFYGHGYGLGHGFYGHHGLYGHGLYGHYGHGYGYPYHYGGYYGKHFYG